MRSIIRGGDWRLAVKFVSTPRKYTLSEFFLSDAVDHSIRRDERVFAMTVTAVNHQIEENGVSRSYSGISESMRCKFLILDSAKGLRSQLDEQSAMTQSVRSP